MEFLFLFLFPNLLGHREIQALGVWCNNVERGCDWEGTVGTLEDNVTKFGFILVPCPNGCMQDGEFVMLFLKNTVERHLTEQCTDKTYQYKEHYYYVIAHHESECVKMKARCPNESCCETVQHGLMDEHLSFCVIYRGPLQIC